MSNIPNIPNETCYITILDIAKSSQTTDLRVRHGGDIWTLVVRRVSNPYLINSGAFLMEDISFVKICEEQDNKLFLQILRNEKHVLHQLLPPVRNVPYSLRPKAPDREVPVANATMRKDFIYRMLYLDSYYNFLIVLDITGIFMNSPVLSVNFIFIFVY